MPDPGVCCLPPVVRLTSAIVVFQNRRGGSDFDRAKQVGLVLASAVEADLP